MKRISIIILAATIFVSCSSSKKTEGNYHDHNDHVRSMSEERDGSSYDKAIIINEKTENPGVAAEYTWLKKHYPGYHTQGQSLNNHDKKPYDIITIKTSDGETKKVYFDISKFYGHLG